MVYLLEVYVQRKTEAQRMYEFEIAPFIWKKKRSKPSGGKFDWTRACYTPLRSLIS